MAKISQVITRPSVEYDYTIAEAQTRDLDAIVEKLGTVYKVVADVEVRSTFLFTNELAKEKSLRLCFVS